VGGPLAVGDFNGDGHLDIAVGSFYNDALSILLNTCTPTKACVGDCDSSGDVTVNELITLVDIDLGTTDASACSHGISSGVSVDITLIIQAVGYALTQCPAA